MQEHGVTFLLARADVQGEDACVRQYRRVLLLANNLDYTPSVPLVGIETA